MKSILTAQLTQRLGWTLCVWPNTPQPYWEAKSLSGGMSFEGQQCLKCNPGISHDLVFLVTGLEHSLAPAVNRTGLDGTSACFGATLGFYQLPRNKEATSVSEQSEAAAGAAGSPAHLCLRYQYLGLRRFLRVFNKCLIYKFYLSLYRNLAYGSDKRGTFSS